LKEFTDEREKVEFTYFIPNEDPKLKGAMSELQKGYLLHWGVSFIEFEAGGAPYTVVYIEKEDGQVIETYPENMRFLRQEHFES